MFYDEYHFIQLFYLVLRQGKFIQPCILGESGIIPPSAACVPPEHLEQEKACIS